MDLSIVIPLFNEEKNINKLYKKLCQIFKKKNVEIIFVDDNSYDSSSKILKELSKKDRRVVHLHRKKERDLTQSCIDGFIISKFNNILVMDCDLQHSPMDIKSMITKYIKEKADFVIGTRDFKKKHIGLSYTRSLASISLTLIINIFLGKKLNDPMSGFFLFRKKIFFKVKKKLFGKGYKILFDMIYLSDHKTKVIEHEITLYKRNSGDSKMKFKTLLQIILQILRLFCLRLIK